jgi:septal ring factor EnvC (AmiA/AmiB activator)
LNPAVEEELEQLRADIASKSVTIHAQAEEMAELYAALDQLKVYEVVCSPRRRGILTEHVH